MGIVSNRYELDLMRKSGQIAGSALKKTMEAAKVGVTGLDLDKIAEQEIYRLGGDLSYKTVPGYKYATCVTINEQVVHGIPTDRKFKAGDLVSVDLAVEYRGWHTDCAWSTIVKSSKLKVESEREEFLKKGEQTLWEAVSQAKVGNRIGDISSTIQDGVEGAGYSVIRSLVGHGIGKHLHEDPEVPGYGAAGQGVVLKTGMALAIEVIYAKGGYDLALEKDGWTYSTVDGSDGGLFEMTVIVGKQKPEILTKF